MRRGCELFIDTVDIYQGWAMEKLTIEQLKELLEFHYEYDDLVTIRNHIECVIENIDNGNYDNISNWLKYEQEMDNIKFCNCGCIINNNEHQCDDCKEGL